MIHFVKPYYLLLASFLSRLTSDICICTLKQRHVRLCSLAPLSGQDVQLSVTIVAM